ncbi:putative feruloyl esterase [Metarhizium anisopliae]
MRGARLPYSRTALESKSIDDAGIGALQSCSPSTFTHIDLFGSQVISIAANIVTNYTKTAPHRETVHHPTIEVKNATFCNVTVTYTHPGQGDVINVETWLPIGDWNQRLLAVGGGGYAAGRFVYSELAMAAALGQGFATVTTDAGLGESVLAHDWALLSPGNVNLYKLHNLASRSLHDESIIAKSVIKKFYGKAPEYSYWSGCSQGGRQGLMLAQRYPSAYDGIVATAPALNWGELVPGFFWPQVIMNELGEYPAPCELSYLAEAAVGACDGLDGVVDGVISHMDKCEASFDSFSYVGTELECSELGRSIKLSRAAAVVANATWSGPRGSDGNFLWYGIGYGSSFQEAFGAGVATTQCSQGKCVGVPSLLGTQWLQLFVEKNPAFDVKEVTRTDFERLFHTSVLEYSTLLGTRDPDLSAFRSRGGKILSFHGLNDQLIPYKGTDQYYDSVLRHAPDARDFYRYFHIPGYGHCAGGNHAAPTTGFSQLRAWVEQGKAPETVEIQFKNAQGKEFHRLLCPYPQQAHFNGGDSTKANSFVCRE